MHTHSRVDKIWNFNQLSRKTPKQSEFQYILYVYISMVVCMNIP